MSVVRDERYMRMAIAKARQGIRLGQTPFGACIVRAGKVLSCAHNVVWRTTDITAHAEVTAIRQACKKIGDISLEGSVLYSTCEPCPMCFSAAHWARIDTIMYGAQIRDAKAAGFHELTVSNKKLKAWGHSDVRIVSGFLKEECVALFAAWQRKQKGKGSY